MDGYGHSIRDHLGSQLNIKWYIRFFTNPSGIQRETNGVQITGFWKPNMSHITENYASLLPCCTTKWKELKQQWNWSWSKNVKLITENPALDRFESIKITVQQLIPGSTITSVIATIKKSLILKLSHKDRITKKIKRITAHNTTHSCLLPTPKFAMPPNLHHIQFMLDPLLFMLHSFFL